MQSVVMMLSVSNASQVVAALDVFAVLLASLGHDLEHPGVTAAFLVLAGVAMLAGGAYWLWRKLRGTPRGGDDDILVATRGPDGWTVDLGR